MDNNMFTVLPMNQRISLKAGETYEGTISVVNPVDATENFKYKAEVTPYGVTVQDHADYLINLTDDSEYTTISKWIEIKEPTGEVKPNETKEIHFVIKVPENAPPGGQYATISISSDNDSNTSEGVAVQNVFEMASIIYATVEGEVQHDGEILENNVPGFVVNTPARLTALISNHGNIHEDATFVITVSDFFTGRVILPTEEEDGYYSEIVMPGTTRFIERDVNNLPALGVVKVNQTIYYQGESSVVEKNIIICPIWFMALVVATIAAIVATIVHLVKKHRKKRVVS